MELDNTTKKLFAEAGWYTGRNVIHKYQHIPGFGNLPDFLKDFLNEYGDMKVYYEPIKAGTKPLDAIIFDPREVGFDDESDADYFKNHYGFAIYPFAYSSEGAGYRIVCDDQAKVYMLGAKDFLMGDNLQEGIRNILSGNFEAKVFDENSKTWI